MANLNTPSMQDLLTAGAHFGHKISRGHPRMKPYIFGARDGVHILDLSFTEEKLKEATEAAYKFGSMGKVMLIVGTKKQAHQIVEELAKEADTPYLTERWVGGMLTNFEEMKKNIKRLLTLKEEKEKGQLSHYTKRERLLISRKVEKFEREMGGIAKMALLPDLLFVVDAVSDNIAVKEALRMGIKIIGISDTNADPTQLDYAVPANDDGIKSIKLICETIIGAYAQGKKEAGKAATEALEKAAKEKEQKEEELKLEGQVAEEAAALEEQIEKEIVADQARKVE